MLTFYVEKHVIKVLTSFVGSYCAVRGASSFIGGFPSEFEIYNIITAGDLAWSDFPKTFYIYIAAIVIMFILSLMF